jgi:hypothetical protein
MRILAVVLDEIAAAGTALPSGGTFRAAPLSTADLSAQSDPSPRIPIQAPDLQLGMVVGKPKLLNLQER